MLHIELRRWADALLIAPLSANTLAKISNGICDNLVTLLCRCWDMKLRENDKNKENGTNNMNTSHKLIRPIVVAPAMNTMMWDQPITEEQLSRIKKWGYSVVEPI